MLYLRILALCLLIPSTLPLFGKSENPTVNFKWEGTKSFQIQASIPISASEKTIWNTVTDYTKLPSFIKQIVVSDVLERKDKSLVLKQVGRSYFLMIFSIDFEVHLQIDEKPTHELSFRDKYLQDFEKFEGTWSISAGPQKGQFILTYAAVATLKERAIKFLAEDLITSGTEDVLTQLRSEIDRRVASCQKLGAEVKTAESCM